MEFTRRDIEVVARIALESHGELTHDVLSERMKSLRQSGDLVGVVFWAAVACHAIIDASKDLADP